MNLFPDVQHAAAGRVDQHTALLAEILHLRCGHTKSRKDNNVVRLNIREAHGWIIRVSENYDALSTQPRVDVRIVNNLSDKKDALVRELLSRFVRVLHGPIDAITEAEFTGQLHAQIAGSCVVSKLF